MKILLVNPACEPVDQGPGLRSVEREFGIIPPINLLYVASSLIKAGADVSVADGMILGIPSNKMAQYIIEQKPDVIGFTATAFSYHQVLGLARQLRSMCEATIIIGGLHASKYAGIIAKDSAFDYVAIGEFEQNANDFFRLLKNEISPEDVSAIAYTRTDGTVRVNPAAPSMDDLDSIPVPARQLIDNAACFSLLSKWRNFTLMLSSRGCPWRCRFCEHSATAYRMRSAANVIQEMEDAHRRFAIQEFDFVDSNFCLDRSRVLEIADHVNRRFHFSARARVNDLDSDLIKALSLGGCFRLHLGVESSSPEVLNVLNKKVDIDRVPGIVKAARQYGVAIVAYFMIGNPGETELQARRTAQFSRSLPFDFVQFTRTSAMPDTELYKDYISKTGRDPWKDFHKTGLMKEFPVVNEELNAKWVDRFVNASYLRFYLRPSAVLRVMQYFQLKRCFSLLRVGLSISMSWLKNTFVAVKK